MKPVLLVNPPEVKFEITKDPMPPLGLALLAAILERENIPVQILDASLEQLSLNDLANTVKEIDPGIIGITGTTWNRFDSFETARALKKSLPSVPLVYGGAHATFTANDTLANLPEMDIVVRGEGDFTFLDIVKNIYSGKNIDSVKGVSYRKNGKIIHNVPADVIMDVDALPTPARHLLDIQKYNEQLFGKKSTSVMTSRGCPMKCVFCSTSKLWGEFYRCRSPKLIGEELENLVNTYGIQATWFFDDTLTLKRSHIEGILSEMKTRKLSLEWYGAIRVNTVDKDLLKAMKDSGCKTVSFGVGNGSQRTLEKIDKGINLNQVQSVIDWCQELNIKTKAFFMLGLPDETMEDAMKTVNLIKEYKDKVETIALAGGTSLLPGTTMTEWATEKGYFPKDFSWVKPYYNMQNPTIGRDPRLPTLIQPQMGYKQIRELNFLVKDRLIPWEKLSKRIKKYVDPREFIKDIILLESALLHKIKSLFN